MIQKIGLWILGLVVRDLPLDVISLDKRFCSGGKKRFQQTVKPLSPDIKMHILLTTLHTFLMGLVSRICLNTKTAYPC